MDRVSVLSARRFCRERFLTRVWRLQQQVKSTPMRLNGRVYIYEILFKTRQWSGRTKRA